MNIQKKRPKTALLPYAVIWVLFFLSLLWVFFVPTRQEVSVDFYFKQSSPALQSQIFWDKNGALSPDACADGIREGNIVTFSLPISPDGLKVLRIDPSNTEEVYTISHVGFLLNGEYFLTMQAQQIAEHFIPVNATLSVNGEELTVTPQNTDSGLFLDSAEVNRASVEASAALRSLQVRQRFFTVLSGSVLLCLFVFFRKDILAFIHGLFTKDKSRRFDWFTLMAVAIMGGACLVVFLTGAFSELGLHPDEWDVKACLDYGMTHFFPPHMLDPEVAGTYSGYGYTKLENYTWYFFLAGKVALLFKTLFYGIAYYRIPNLILFGILAFLFVRNVRHKNWLMAAFGICVQAWYIFSYTTADALDFFLGFCIVWLLADESSLLYRTVDRQKLSPKDIPAFLLLGVLFGNILLGKQCYWAMLPLVFTVLLLRLIFQKDKAARRALWRNYFIILGIFFATFAFRAAFDVFHYGADKAAVKETAAIEHADYDKNPLTPIEEQNRSWHMYAKGDSIMEVFRENPDWFSMTYKSFCGLLQDHSTASWYYWCMGGLYLALFAGAAFYSFRKGSTLSDRIIFSTGSLLMVGELLASILNSWLIDSMAQGRYLLPDILIFGYLVSRVPGLTQKRWYRALLTAAGVLSVAYFGLRGIPEFF